MRTALSVAFASLILFGGSTSVARGNGGTLDVKSDPAARIIIDDKDTGHLTPSTLELPAGHHQLLLVTPDGSSQRSMGFTLAAGQVLKLSFHLGPGARP
jgi:hypothetical protein